MIRGWPGKSKNAGTWPNVNTNSFLFSPWSCIVRKKLENFENIRDSSFFGTILSLMLVQLLFKDVGNYSLRWGKGRVQYI